MDVESVLSAPPVEGESVGLLKTPNELTGEQLREAETIVSLIETLMQDANVSQTAKQAIAVWFHGSFCRPEISDEASDTPDATSAWNQALTQRGIIHHDGKVENGPRFIGGKGLAQLPNIEPPLISLSQTVDSDHISAISTRLTARLADTQWYSKIDRKRELFQLHPFACTKLVSLITEEAIGIQGLQKINNIVVAARKFLQEGMHNHHNVISTATDDPFDMSFREKEFAIRLRGVMNDQSLNTNTFCKFTRLFDSVLLVESYMSLYQMIEQNPTGEMAKRVNSAIDSKPGLKAHDKLIKYAANLLGRSTKDKTFVNFLARYKPLWYIQHKVGWGFLMLVNLGNVVSTIRHMSASVAPYFADIIAENFPELKELCSYVEHNIMKPLCGRDEAAFMRVIGKTLSVDSAGPDMMTRLKTTFPAEDADSTMSG